TDSSFVKLTPEKPLNLSAFTLCMHVATELQGAREIILFAYRTQYYDEFNVWREKDGRFSFYLSGNGVLFRLPPLSTFQTHLCITWDSACIEKVTQFVLVVPSCSARILIIMWVALRQVKALAVYSNQEPYVPKGNVLDWNTIKYEITGNVVVAQNN
ncbi:hypothetical protein M9458_047473, partial [Cirrhinus mrigala]